MEKARFEIEFEDVGAVSGARPIRPRPPAAPKKSIASRSWCRPTGRGVVAAGQGRFRRRNLPIDAGLKTVIARASATPTLELRTVIFDEVERASRARGRLSGERLKRLSRRTSAFSHSSPADPCLPITIYSVDKVERAGRIFASVQYWPRSGERATELARMLSGRRITEAVIEHAPPC